MNKVYERTENGVTSIVSLREGLDEINHAMMSGRKNVKTMSAGRGNAWITYKDGRKVTLIKVDAPVEIEPEDWACTFSSLRLHRFAADGRALCNRRYHAYDRPISNTDRRVRRTLSEIKASEYSHHYTICPKCSEL